MILVYGGLGWGEAVALRRGSCNLLRSRLLVTESLSEVNGVLHFGPTKTHQRRSVSLPSFVCERLREHLDSEVGTSDDSLVFTSDRGAPVRYSNFRNRVWLPATRAAGLEGIGTHIGRHTSATLLLEAGADVKGGQSHLGHRDATMTLNVYCAPYDGKLDELAARIDAAWRVARGEMPAAKRSIPLFHVCSTATCRPAAVPKLQAPDLRLRARPRQCAPSAGFEPATHGLGNRRSIP